ncbi:hypothetical protein LCGC14_2318350, partial [marine sediment metagenome]
MEEDEWKKDETPYLVFACLKCRQYLYVKTIKKNKKCLRCGRSHTISLVEKSGDIVKGITTAVEFVKQKQHELALKELGEIPNFQTVSGFRVIYNEKETKSTTTDNLTDNLTESFKRILIELHNSHKEFPLYMIEFMAEKHNIPKSDIEL